MADVPPSRSLPGGVDPLARYELSAPELKRVLEAVSGEDACLVWRDDGADLRIELLTDEARPRSIGRRDGVDIKLAWDLRVSGVHARLECAAGEWTVGDDAISTNGTFVNEQRVAGRQRLANDDRIRVGGTILVFKQRPAGNVLPTQVDGAQLPARRPTPGQQRVLVALCAPLLSDPAQRLPATNQVIAEVTHLSIGAVKMHLRGLFEKFELEHVGQHDKRVRLAERAVASGLVRRHDVPPDR
jgi:FHA domain